MFVRSKVDVDDSVSIDIIMLTKDLKPFQQRKKKSKKGKRVIKLQELVQKFALGPDYDCSLCVCAALFLSFMDSFIISDTKLDENEKELPGGGGSKG